MADTSEISGNVDPNVLIDKISKKLDSITRLSVEPPSFSDLPNEILGKIVEKLDLMSGLNTRKVSRRFRSVVVYNQNAHYDEIRIFTKPNYILIHFDKNVAIYKNNDDKCLIGYHRAELQFKQKFLNGDFMEIALNDLEIAMKSQKVQLGELSLVFDETADYVNNKVLNLLKSLKSPIHIKSIRIGETIPEEDVLPILSLAKPGALEKIFIDGMRRKLNVNQLVKMNQWKQAKRVDIKSVPIGIEHCIHLNIFDVIVQPLSTEDVLRLRDVLSKSPNFKSCSLSLFYHNPLNLENIGRAFEAAVVQNNFVTHRHPILGTKQFLDFKVYPCYLSIDRNH